MEEVVARVEDVVLQNGFFNDNWKKSFVRLSLRSFTCWDNFLGRWVCASVELCGL